MCPAIAPLLLAAQLGPFLPSTPDLDLGGLPSATFGRVVRSAGDVDGDGHVDLLVLATSARWVAGVHGQGAVFVHRGGPGGFEASATWEVRGDLQGGPTPSVDACGAGDVNGDGYDDIAISTHVGAGAVHVFHGGPGGIHTGPRALMSDADWVGAGTTGVGLRFGAALLGPGDVDGDGFDDLVISDTHRTTPGLVYDGAVYLFRGSASGLPRVGAQPAREGDAAWSLAGGVTHGYLGTHLHATGDIEGDGYADFVVTGEGIAGDTSLLRRHVVIRGGSGGPPPGLGGARWIFGGTQASGAIGRRIASADFDGDGYVDIVLGFPNRSYQGLEPIELWRGTATGFELVLHRAAADPWFEGAGIGLAAGDIDGDGAPDLAVLSSSYTVPGGTPRTGRVRVWRGTGSPHGWLESSPAWTWIPSRRQALHGGSVACVGDPEGDFSESLAIGMPYDASAGSTWDGRAVVFSAPGDGPEPCALAAPHWTFAGDEGERFGGARVAGDFDGDGFDDLLVAGTTPTASSPHLRLFRGGPGGPEAAPSRSWTFAGPAAVQGARPAGVGDVNGDGYDDAQVLLPGRAHSTWAPQLFTPARALVLHGSPGGLGSPVWFADPAAQGPTHFAASGGIPGDLDGDGFDDVVLGARGFGSRYDPNAPAEQGRVYLYRGSAQGVNGGVPGTEANAAWSAVHPDPLAEFGRAVQGAGDVDGDGFDDLLVGAPFENVTASSAPLGALYLFRGGPGGPVGTSPASAHQRLEGAQQGRTIGLFQDAGVDVTGDGRPDLVVYEQGAGGPALRLHPGGAAGYGPASPVALPPRSGTHFSFALLEDFDGDGHGDLGIGWPDENARVVLDGLVEVYRGGPSGIAATPGWQGRGFQRRERGCTLLTGADVDGDGRTDLVSSGPDGWRLRPGQRAGRTSVHLGTSGPRLELDRWMFAVGTGFTWRAAGADPTAKLYLAAAPLPAGPGAPPPRAVARTAPSLDGCAVARAKFPRWMTPGRWELTVFEVPPGAAPRASNAVVVELR